MSCVNPLARKSIQVFDDQRMPAIFSGFCVRLELLSKLAVRDMTSFTGGEAIINYRLSQVQVVCLAVGFDDFRLAFNRGIAG